MTLRSDPTVGPGVTAPARRSHRLRLPLAVATLVLVVSVVLAVATGPVGVSLHDLLGTLLDRLPGVGDPVAVSPVDQAIVVDLRLPRVVLAVLVGAMLAAGGTAYQGVLRTSLADPYLLGVAAGAGLGATAAIVSGASAGALVLPVAAFAGAVLAVALTFLVAVAGGGRGSDYAIVLAGVAVAALFTAGQTYLQQQHQDEIRQVYSWLLGSLSQASWSDVRLVLPYVGVAGAVLLSQRRLLDVLRVGPDEAELLGVDADRVRLVVLGAATLGTAAAVAVSGLIGFVGIVVPHAVRLLTDGSYRVVLPVSMVGGAAFLVLADLVARTVQAPAEVPIGVVTAVAGAPFFLLVLRSRRTRQGVL